MYTRKAFFLHPLMRHELRFTNLRTLEHSAPPRGHWERLARHSGALAHALAQPDVADELRAQTALKRARMAKLQARQAALAAALRALPAGAPPTAGAADAGTAGAAAGGGAALVGARRQALLEELEATLYAQLALHNVMTAGSRRLFGIDVIARITLLSHPWWPDWATLIEWFAEAYHSGAGAGGDTASNADDADAAAAAAAGAAAPDAYGAGDGA